MCMISQQQLQKQQLRILPQQIQLLNLYFLSSMELEQRIQAELSENPLLEASEDQGKEEEFYSEKGTEDFRDWEEFRYDDIPDYRSEYQNYFGEDKLPHIPLKNFVHFKEELKQQFRLLPLPEEEMELGLFLIDLLNDRGIMDKDLEDVADDFSFVKGRLVEVKDVSRILEKIQSLEPVGIGARNVRECLLIQLRMKKKDHSQAARALTLIEHYYDELIHRQFEKIQQALSLDDAELKKLFNYISGLNFYPVSDDATQYETKNNIIPDYIISRPNDTVQVRLYHSRSDKVYVNKSLYSQLSGHAAKDRAATTYVKNKLQAAEWFVQAVRQREDTMLRIMTCIVSLQQEYFMDGDIRKLKPMVLRNVADLSGFDISTISRITGNKYAETHFGTIWLKDLFSEGIKDKNGVVISNRVIQSVIEEAIGSENKKSPYTDQQLVEILSAQGYNIARRTVAKYREQLQIPTAQIRAVWVKTAG